MDVLEALHNRVSVARLHEPVEITRPSSTTVSPRDSTVKRAKPWPACMSRHLLLRSVSNCSLLPCVRRIMRN